MATCLGRSSGKVNHAPRREIAKLTVVGWHRPRRAVGDTPVGAVDPREPYTQTIAISSRNTTLAGNGSLDFEQRLSTRNFGIVQDRARDGVTFPGCEKKFLNRKHTLLIVVALQRTFEGKVQVPAPVDVLYVCLGNSRTSWKDNVPLRRGRTSPVQSPKVFRFFLVSRFRQLPVCRTSIGRSRIRIYCHG